MAEIWNTVRDYLKADSDVAALVSTRVYVDAMNPVGYEIPQGDIIVIRPAGGPGSVDYRMAAQNLEIRSVADTLADVEDIEAAVFAALLETSKPQNATAFYAKDISAVDLRRDPGGLYVMGRTYQCSEVVY